MTTEQTGPENKRPLEALGISGPEERAYRWMLGRPDVTVTECARELALTPGKVQRIFDAIEAKGLATHTPERPRRYIPASPDVALNALSLRRQEELRRADGAIQELQEHAVKRRQGDTERMVELLTSPGALLQFFDQVHLTVQHEIICLQRLPILVSRPEVSFEQDHHNQLSALARGVRIRTITDMDCLALPGAITRTREEVKVGEEVRVFPSLPFKMLVADCRIGLLPMNLKQIESPAMLVRSSALLDALYLLFEMLWERSAPISFDRAGAVKIQDPDSRQPQGSEEILSLLAAGMNDKRIADALGISSSTFSRRIAELMETFNARTRFQLGRLSATGTQPLKK